ncbi:hypothetical protein [Staphylococcus epidermidis]|uniref:hypothetical protein n=1 Tax=Staphylococcus epidermidis TaxID=1282 RepID=UPI0011A91618|nr:hypothetical protein [Staphylococcus epidermidis]
MTKERKVVENEEVYEISEAQKFVRKDLLERLKRVYPTKKRIVIFIAYIIISLLIATLIVIFNDEKSLLIKNIIQFITPFYAITIGFSITTIVFILNNVSDFIGIARQNLSDIISLVISYIIIGIATIILFLIITILTNTFNLACFFYFFVFFIVDLMILLSFQLFFTIIKILYLISFQLINKK